jgi:LisH domain-containing protein ARMC9
MIDNSVIEWIVTLLSLQNQSQQPLSEYSLEYATALLMNLSLRSKGKTVCEKMLSSGISLIKVLSDLMEHDNLQVRTHINGTMYSVLTRQALKDEANQLGLGEMLDYLIQAQQDKSYAGEAEEQMQR